VAVYTDVSAAQIAELLSLYDIGTLTSFHGIAEGVENSNFLVQTTAGTYILTLYEKRVAREDLPFFLGLMQHLAKRGLSCPLPVAARSGAMLGELAGRPAAIVTFLPGVSVRRPTAVHCAELGRGLAQLHLAGRDFPMRRANALSVSGWRPLYRGARGRADEVAPGLAATIEEELSDLERDWPAGLPAGVIHADLFPDNAFFLDDALSGIIDFYFACTDFLAYDVAVCLNSWCFEADASYNVTKGRALLAGYESLRPLGADEAPALPRLARGAALRFLLTRLVDWLNVPEGALVRPKDPVEYLRKLRFHRAVDSARDYGLAP
jgi:homoserine kinase type II